jgi:hypothetical protein
MPRIHAVTLAIALSVSLPMCFWPDESRAQLSPDQEKFLESTRQSALDYSKRLPDFICTQITHREVSLLDVSNTAPPDVILDSSDSSWNPKPTEQDDVIKERLTYFGQKEKYEVISFNGKKAVGLDHMQFQGAISIGEFGSDLRQVFAPESKTAFNFDRVANLHGRRILVFHFTVPKENGIAVFEGATGQKVIVSYTGEVFIDAMNFETLRITARLDMPPGFPIRSGERMVEYKPIKIGGNDYNLPFHAEARIRGAKHAYVNRIDFVDYHKFVAESTIQYGDESPR